MVGVAAFLGSEVVLSPVVSGCLPSCGGWVLVGVAASGTKTFRNQNHRFQSKFAYCNLKYTNMTSYDFIWHMITPNNLHRTYSRRKYHSQSHVGHHEDVKMSRTSQSSGRPAHPGAAFNGHGSPGIGRDIASAFGERKNTGKIIIS